MTKKRFHKLFCAEMAKLMKGNDKAGQVLKHTRTCTPVWDKIPGGPSYQAAWTMVRQSFVDMPYNQGITVPER
jgi:hypothetical protein